MLLKRKDRFGGISYITIEDTTKENCNQQVNEMNYYGDLSEIQARFYVMATQQNGIWYDNNDEKLDNEFIKTCLKKIT